MAEEVFIRRASSTGSTLFSFRSLSTAAPNSSLILTANFPLYQKNLSFILASKPRPGIAPGQANCGEAVSVSLLAIYQRVRLSRIAVAVAVTVSRKQP